MSISTMHQVLVRGLSPTTSTYLLSHLTHRLFVRFGHRTLMVTEDSHHTIRMVVCFELFLNRPFLRRTFIQLFLESDGGIVSTEHLGSETFHIRGQVFIERGGLDQKEAYD